MSKAEKANAVQMGLLFNDNVNGVASPNKVRGVVTVLGSIVAGFGLCALVDRSSFLRPGVCRYLAKTEKKGGKV